MNSWGKLELKKKVQRLLYGAEDPAESKTNKSPYLGGVYLWWGYLDS